jgi:hypothetical protein
VTLTPEKITLVLMRILLLHPNKSNTETIKNQVKVCPILRYLVGSRDPSFRVSASNQKMGLGEERRTLVLVNLASIMERADEALLPAVYKEVGAAIHATPTGLGSLTLFRSIVQAACYPLAAYMATRHNRAHVIALGAFLWAAATFLVGISNTFLQVVDLVKIFV